MTDQETAERLDAELERLWGEPYRQFREKRAAWRDGRRREAAEALGWPLDEVTDFWTGFASHWCGRPAPHDPGPQFEPPA